MSMNEREIHPRTAGGFTGPRYSPEERGGDETLSYP